MQESPWAHTVSVASKDGFVEIHILHPSHGHRIARVSQDHFDGMLENGLRVTLRAAAKRPGVALNTVGFYHEGKSKSWSLTRFLFPDLPPGLVRDHINGDTLDDRRENIRFVSKSENALNNHRRRNGTLLGYDSNSRTLSFRVPPGGKYDELRLAFNRLSKQKNGVYNAIAEALL